MAEHMTIEEFYTDFLQEIITTADAEEIYKEEALFEICADTVSDAGEFDEAIYAHYRPASGGMRVDGYCGTPMDNNGTLGLIVLDFSPELEPATITGTEIKQAFKRLRTFLVKALTEKFKNGLEEADPGYGLADSIQAYWSQTKKIKFFLFTNRTISSRIEGIQTEELEDRPLSYSVWDLTRFYRLASSGLERERLEVDFENLPNGPLHALKAFSGRSKDQVYLAVVPATDLALIYDRWGTRLLEQNVRVFLQARSKVNKGIKNTIETQPEHFFSFNNGITATAEKVEVLETEEGTAITRLENLQIVNGGQTTASIYSAFMNKTPLDKVFVQMKLTVVKPEDAIELVPEISRCANSQNKVSAADFFSNHPYHVRIEDFSRRIYAPSKEGSFVQSKWFYERARGQYNDAQSYLTKSKKRKFVEEYPKNQKFTKTDLAKYAMCWTDKVYFVNRGAQKNFAEFAKDITEAWDKDKDEFNEYYFKQIVAKKIIFDAAQKVVPSREWYEPGGYRAQHVSFAVGKIAQAAKEQDKVIDFLRIWDSQSVSDAFTEALGRAADCVHEVLMNPASGYRNISEWAKQKLCWDRVKKASVDWNDDWLEELVDKSAEKEIRTEAVKDQKVVNGIEAQERVIAAGAEFWQKVYDWMISQGEGTDKDRGIVKSAATMSNKKIPSEAQCGYLIQLMDKLHAIGCPHRLRRRRLRL